jgi:hypothetical protein
MRTRRVSVAVGLVFVVLTGGPAAADVAPPGALDDSARVTLERDVASRPLPVGALVPYPGSAPAPSS